MKQYVEDKGLLDIAKEAVKLEPERFINVAWSKVFFVKEVEEVKKETNKLKGGRYAYITSTPKLYRLLTDIVYTIVVVGEKWDEVDDNTKKLIMLHELTHIDSEFSGKLLKHNVEDFKEMLEKYGFNYVLSTTGETTEAKI